MNKTYLAVLAVVVAVLTGWLVVSVAKVHPSYPKPTAQKMVRNESARAEKASGSPATDEVSTSVRILTDKVPTNVTITPKRK